MRSSLGMALFLAVAIGVGAGGVLSFVAPRPAAAPPDWDVEVTPEEMEALAREDPTPPVFEEPETTDPAEMAETMSVEELIDALQNWSEDDRWAQEMRISAARALGIVRPPAVAAVDALADDLVSEAEAVRARENAAWALGEIGGEEAAAALREALGVYAGESEESGLTSEEAGILRQINASLRKIE